MSMITDAEIGAIVTGILKARLPESEFLNAEARSDEDYDGGPIVRVKAHFARPPADLRKFVDSIDVIRTELQRSGEDRLVFLSHAYPGVDDEIDEDVDGDDGTRQ
jgi:hypothetical protein